MMWRGLLEANINRGIIPVKSVSVIILIDVKKGETEAAEGGERKTRVKQKTCQFQPYVVFLRSSMACVWICFSWERDSCRLISAYDSSDDGQKKGGEVLSLSKIHFPVFLSYLFFFLFALSSDLETTTTNPFSHKDLRVNSALRQNRWLCETKV